MGFGDIAGALGGGLFGGITGAFRGPGDGPGVGQLDDRYKKLRDKQNEMAKEFSPQDAIKNQGGLALGNSRRQLASSMAGIKQGAQSRGQLYSGLKQQADLAAQNQSSADLNNQMADISRQEYLNADKLNAQAAASSLDYRDMAQQRENMLYQQALDRRQGRTGMMNAAAGGAGSLIGAFAGGA